MWLRWFLAASLALAAPLAARSQPTPTAERQTLALKLTDEIGRPLTSGRWQLASVESNILDMSIAFGWNDAPAASRPPKPNMDRARLVRSLEMGVAETSPKLRQALADAYARALDADTLRAADAFYATPAEQAAFQRRETLSVQVTTQQANDVIDLSLSDAQRAAHAKAAQAVAEQIAAPTPAETAFNATPAGKALHASESAIQQAVSRAAPPLWGEAMDAAERDYCAKRPCDAASHATFRRLRDYFDPKATPAADVTTPGQPDPDRLALGRRVEADLGPTWRLAGPQIAMVEQALHSSTMPDSLEPMFLGDDSGAARAAVRESFELPQLHASLVAGANAVAPRLCEAMAAAYAETFDADTLQAAARFYERPEEQASLANRRAVTDKLDELLANVGSSPDDMDRYRVQSEALLTQLNQFSPAERQFMASAASRAIAGGANMLQRQFGERAVAIWPDLAAAARADYCAKQSCAGAQDHFFAALPAALGVLGDIAAKSRPTSH